MSRPGDTKSVAVEVLTEMVKKVTVDKLIGGTSALCAMCLGGPIPVVTSVAGVVAAMALFGAIKLKKAAKDRDKDEEQAGHCVRVATLLEQNRSVLERLESGQASDAKSKATLAALADIALQQPWFKDAIAKGPAAFNEAWKKETAACADAIKDQLAAIKRDTAQIQSTLAELAHLEFDTNWRVREIAIVLNTHTDLLNQILSHVKPHPSREEIEREIRPRLEQEIEAKLRREQTSPGIEDLQTQAKRLADIAITALNTKGFAERAAEVGGTLAVLEGLQKQAAQHEAAALHHIEASVAIWRKTAEWAFLVGEIDTAAGLLQKILAVRPGDIDATNRLGLTRWLLGNLDEACKLFGRVLELDSERLYQSVALGNLGQVEQSRGNFEVALQHFHKSLEIDEASMNYDGMAASYGNVGTILLELGDIDTAEDYFLKSLVVNEFSRRPDGVAGQYGNLGNIRMARGDYEGAKEYYEKSLVINKELGLHAAIALCYGNLAVLSQYVDDLPSAQHYLELSLAISEKVGMIETSAQTYHNLGITALLGDNAAGARRALTKALELYHKLGNPGLEAEVQAQLDRLPPE